MQIAKENNKNPVKSPEWFEFESYGKVVYDPYRPGLKGKKKNWWAIMTVDREITRYFRWQVLWNWGIKLNHPSWDAHVSIIRGEKPQKNKMDLWKKYQGKKVKFRYSNKIFQADNKPEFWYVHIDCPFLKEIREEFGLPADWRLHLTIGRTWSKK